MNELICFSCLTDLDGMPGVDSTKAVTTHQGTALCAAHAREASQASSLIG